MPADMISDFNPRSREGSDIFGVLTAVIILISIHAPVKGATVGTGRRRHHRNHFNPRSREGSDATLGQHFEDWLNFNPRSREGSDLHRLY